MFGVKAGFLKATLDKTDLILSVVNNKAGVNVYRPAVSAQDAGTNSMKSAQGQIAYGTANQLVQPLFHCAGRLVGEGNGHDAEGANATNSGEVSDTVSDNPGLATAGTGQDKHRPLNRLHGFPLCRIKLSQYIHS